MFPKVAQSSLGILRVPQLPITILRCVAGFDLGEKKCCSSFAVGITLPEN